jgi:hypothetical protein
LNEAANLYFLGAKYVYSCLHKFKNTAFRFKIGIYYTSTNPIGKCHELHQEKCYFPIGENAWWRSNRMSQKSQHELLEVVRPRYWKAGKVEKQKILDEFTRVRDYPRKDAIRVLKNRVATRQRRKRTGYQTIYRGEVVQALEQICSKRLQPFLPEAIRVLERCQEINISKDTKELLLKISSASIDRCLGPIRIQSPHGLSTTKPGSLLQTLIPVRTFTEWDEERPGFLEIELVAHTVATLAKGNSCVP